MLNNKHKNVLFVFLCFIFLIKVSSLITNKEAGQILISCLKEFGYAEYIAGHTEINEDEPMFKCAMLCYLKGLGVLIANNETNIQRTIKLVVKLDRLLEKSAQSITETCMKKFYDFEDECEAANYLLICIDRLGSAIKHTFK